jgi:hypothetical protein
MAQKTSRPWATGKTRKRRQRDERSRGQPECGDASACCRRSHGAMSARAKSPAPQARSGARDGPERSEWSGSGAAQAGMACALARRARRRDAARAAGAERRARRARAKRVVRIGCRPGGDGLRARAKSPPAAARPAPQARCGSRMRPLWARPRDANRRISQSRRRCDRPALWPGSPLASRVRRSPGGGTAAAAASARRSSAAG